MWHPVKVVAPPMMEPVSVDDAKRQCRILVDDAEFDAELNRICKAARDHVEAYCGIRFAEWSVVMECNSFADFSELPEAPLKSIASIAYVDATGNDQILDEAIYEVGGTRFAPSIVLKGGQVWPEVEWGARIVVTATVGGEVPESVAHAMLIFVADSFNQRENAKAENWTVLDILLCNQRRSAA